MSRMINYIVDAIRYGLDKDFWSEDSCLVEGCHECYGEQLDCESLLIWKDDINGTMLHLSLGAGKKYQITVEEEMA